MLIEWRYVIVFYVQAFTSCSYLIGALGDWGRRLTEQGLVGGMSDDLSTFL